MRGAVDGHDAGRHHARGIKREDDRRQRAGRQIRNGGRGQRVDLRKGPVGIDVARVIIPHDAGADDRPRFLPARAGGLAGPAFHAVGDVLFDAAGRHAAVERQHLHGGAWKTGRMSIGIRVTLSPPITSNVSTTTVTAYALFSEARIKPFMRLGSRCLQPPGEPLRAARSRFHDVDQDSVAYRPARANHDFIVFGKPAQNLSLRPLSNPIWTGVRCSRASRTT